MIANCMLWTGLTGIVVARFYMDIHPECRLVILEEDTVVGGVWSSSMFGGSQTCAHD